MNGKQLKNSILQWAIQGKLVPQDPNDEPASVLLERIRAEKARLVKEKKIKKDKNESIIYRGDDNSYYEKFLATGEVKCIDDEIPFEIPKGWEWCRLKHMCSMQAGKNISASEIYDKKSVLHPYRCVGGNGLRGFTNTFNAEGHFAIIGRQGALCGCLNIESGKFYATEHAVVVNGFGIIPSLFIYYFFTALNLNQYATATAQPGLAVSNIVEVFIPLPPLPEQLRIVSKIEKLLPLVKTYEQAQNGLNELNASLNEQLRKSILQEAIQGKLVPQCSDEGTAQELLEQIKLEKQKLIKDGKLKKSALTDSVIFKGDDNKYYEQVGNENIDITEEIPFDLPENWTWVRFGQYVRMSIGKTPPRGETKYWANGKYPWVSISDMSDYGLVTTTKESVSEYAKSLFGEISPVGTLIMSFKLTVGRTSLLNTSAYHNEAIISIYPFVDKNYQARNFLFHILPIISNLGDTKDAIKGKTLNSKSLNNLLLPLPPLNEQGRIVAMIELLFDKLK
ncbi:restriction endonuclease subunit S [Bacteroides fragilis]|jgi:type I restriction enzyme S subunit|nr:MULTISPECIES: restriction endonuclease subunit S [Bacteroidaceae]MCI6832774.1 restriction endonuclease subunit S [Phocaeicola vulgatus]MCS3196238.1 restriction endonuclease subunit S [Bacteroides thetaiotaomicron]RHI55007.1 restriction endonuclease subunit S [Phocaeicola vulgatus]TWV74320.1 restriction endonuclease subunit S [Bacteroides fragilis]